MLFVIHATDKKDGMATRAKFYRAHRIHLDQAEQHFAAGKDTETTIDLAYIAERTAQIAEARRSDHVPLIADLELP